LGSGGNASSKSAWKACKTCPDPDAPGNGPPAERLAVVALASTRTDDHDRPENGWTLDQIAATLVNDGHARAVHRSTVWRILDACQLKPHQSRYWLNSHDPDEGVIAKRVCSLYVEAPALHRRGHLLVGTDEKTGLQILERAQPTRPAIPGHPERRERDYLRHGTRCRTASFLVPTGPVVWDLTQTRTGQDFAGHLLHVLRATREFDRVTWVLDNLNTHNGLPVCEVLAAVNGRPFWPRELRTGAQRRAFLSDSDYPHRLVFLPKHGSWLNQVELFFGVVARRFLRRGEFASAGEFEARLGRFLDDYNGRPAHPYRWTYPGEPLVRATPWCQRRRQRRPGRAWFGTRPQLFDRLLHRPRPYRRRQTKPLAANL